MQRDFAGEGGQRQPGHTHCDFAKSQRFDALQHMQYIH